MADTEIAEGRPSPDALLAAANRERRGKLKVFLGAAPGVGKTYAMLSSARRLKQEGWDVAVGLIETHGRSETAALLDGLEILPRREIGYRGQTVSEFDIDGALARRPQLIVVDELAHTNGPGSRHPKRYLDVEELLAAGIDVWTTINIQHLESLSDLVARITGVAVRETVPDTILDRADEMVVVDITPDELIQRLRDGKVYLPDNAQKAADNFFRLGNLTALRELALRRTADRVDDQVVAYRQEHGVDDQPPAAERILVCIGPDSLSEIVVRTASRLASGLNATWIAVHLDRAGSEPLGPDTLRRLDHTVALAERLGAETRRLSARDLPTEILRLARRENATQIVIGRSHRGFVGRLFGRSLTDEIVARASDIAVHIVTGSGRSPRAPRRNLTIPPIAHFAASVAIAAGCVGVAVGIGKVLTFAANLPNLSLVFIAAVMVSALTYGLTTAIAAAFLSFAAFNFFFIDPLYTFTIAAPYEVFALFVFLFVAVFTGVLAGRLRDQSESVRRRAKATEALYDFSRKLSGTAKTDDVAWATAAQVVAVAASRALILLPADGEVVVRAAYPPDDNLSATDRAAARWAFLHREPAGWSTNTLPAAEMQFRPLTGAGGLVGVVAFAPRDLGVPLTSDEERTLASLFDQAGVAIERARLVEEIAATRALAEGEKLRSALLSSISHDLRTPLAAILGAVTSLRSLGPKMADAARADLLVAIQEETERLDRFVANLLEMTRLEAGVLDIRSDWVDIGDAVRAAVHRAERIHGHHHFAIDVTPGMPPAVADPMLLEQALVNVLDNAAKYAPDEPDIAVAVKTASGRPVVTITDRGPGIAPADLPHVFDKFYRARRGDSQAPGTGLGLAIVRGLIEAMGGKVAIESPVDAGRGTRVTLLLRAEVPPGDIGSDAA
jgi:two-component system sensor histidine kinase KdpD